MAEAARQTAEAIPAWDGNARGWRRYSREVMWYVLGTKMSNRAFLAPRLIAKLTGPARLLAMSWSQIDFKGKNGVQTLLKRLAASPLSRKNLPTMHTHACKPPMAHWFLTYRSLRSLFKGGFSVAAPCIGLAGDLWTPTKNIS